MLGASLPYQVRRCSVPDDPFLTPPTEPVNRFLSQDAFFFEGPWLAWGWLVVVYSFCIGGAF